MAKSPSVIAFAGRRVDPKNAKEKQFPFEKVEAVHAALKAYMDTENAIALVSSAACGADLTAIRAATSLRQHALRTRIVLPFSPERFRQTSVVDLQPAEY